MWHLTVPDNEEADDDDNYNGDDRRLGSSIRDVEVLCHVGIYHILLVQQQMGIIRSPVFEKNCIWVTR